MSILEKYKTKHKFYKVKSLVQKYSLDKILRNEQLQEFEIEYLIINYKLIRSNWTTICVCQKLSENFIEKHINLVDWYYISCFQTLSEEFIERHSDLVYWNFIYKHQELTEEFIEKHKYKV